MGMFNSHRKQKNFFEGRNGFENLFKKRNIMLFLDFDGTLAVIVDHYKSAMILQESKVLLKQIVKNPKCLVAIVSGRALSDVKKRVGLKNIFYAGNHGLEVAGPGINYTSFVEADVKRRFRKMHADLVRSVGRIKGVLIENKGLTLSVHYRRVTDKDFITFEQVFLECVWPYIKDRRIDISEGKKVFEIRPDVEWNKGRAVLWFMKHLRKNNRRQKFLPMFFGDDVTDETAFVALKDKGLCIRVGCGKTSSAQYCFENINQVTRFLKIILDSKS